MTQPDEVTVHCIPAEDVMRVTIGKRQPRLLHLSSPMTADAILDGARLARDEAVTELVSTNRYNHAELELVKRCVKERRELVRDFAELYEDLRISKAGPRTLIKYVREFVDFYYAI